MDVGCEAQGHASVDLATASASFTELNKPRSSASNVQCSAMALGASQKDDDILAMEVHSS